MKTTVITTFPNHAWDIYAHDALQSFVRYWPAEVPLLVQLDDNLLHDDVSRILRPQDAVAVGWEAEHAAFVARNKGRDHPNDYRMQAVRFCHKVFSIHRALVAIEKQWVDAPEEAPRYLIWMDADVITTKPVTLEDLALCLPKEGDSVAYLGRKDWDHSECGWLAFDLEAAGDAVIKRITKMYCEDRVFEQVQWHDSWIWDSVISTTSCTNLTEDKPGREIWQHSPMAAWSVHHKGPEAKEKLFYDAINKNIMPRFYKMEVSAPAELPQQQPMRVEVRTRNAVPDEVIQSNIRKNQALIESWIKPCAATDEKIAVVAAGPMLVAEELRDETAKIVAVKNALNPLKKAGVKPWACILLDPRPHVADFIQNADKEILWFVASQVDPKVTIALLAQGCKVWGYHASVNAGEEGIIIQQPGAIIHGGTATATRGLHVLHHLGFSNFRLYGYDLCLPDKPDLDMRDELGQPKYMEVTIGINDPLYSIRRVFWTEPQFYAQFEELNALAKDGVFKMEAFGDGIVPFALKIANVAKQRRAEAWERIRGENPPDYGEMLAA